VSPILADAVTFVTAKLRPFTVMDLPPEPGLFAEFSPPSLRNDTMGASNVYATRRVPTRPATLITAALDAVIRDRCRSSDVMPAEEQVARVADVQLDVRHGRALRLLVDVMSVRPKFKPMMDREVLVVDCRFWNQFVTAGQSKESSSCPVPAMEATVTDTGNGPLLGMASKNSLSVGVVQAKAVLEVQVDETHGIAPAKRTVGVMVSMPKLVPRNETGAPAERGIFPRTSLTIGASKVKNSEAVPATLLTVASAHVTN
jgi:hypothetical protein